MSDKRISAPRLPGSSGLGTFFLTYRRPIIVAIQLALVALSNNLAFQLRFDGQIPDWAFRVHAQSLPVLILIRGLAFLPFGLYEGLWRYASIWDLRNIVVSVAASSVLFYAYTASPIGVETYPRSIFIIDALLVVCFLGGIRLTSRVYRDVSQARTGRGVLIYGAGDAGEMIAREMRKNPAYGYDAIGFVDDDPTKLGSRIHGVPVLGTGKDLRAILRERRPEEVVIAIPTATPKDVRRIVQSLEPHKVQIKTLPNLRDLMNGRVELSQIRHLAIEDLLERKRVDLDTKPVKHLVEGRRVLVTGAGGSIGSELSRQIARFRPGRLILYERYENGLHAITMRLKDENRAGGLYPVLGDITDIGRLDSVMAEHQPEIVFHAAAHKHVPVMEDNPCEAVKNNVTGTRVMAEAAERHGVDRFILISTDKAVNPTSVMGATKRVAELLLQVLAPASGTSFCTVRFGNVLASAGSVVPRFLEQIKAGGPVTVTHPEMHRYFMLIPEAVELVLHAAARGNAGEVYVLRMGEQIPVLDVARNLIRLSGFVPDEDIAIAFTGIRPGEKLYEELVGPDEAIEPSDTPEIMRVQPLHLPAADYLMRAIEELERRAKTEDASGVLEQLRVMIPEFQLGSVPRPTAVETAAPGPAPAQAASSLQTPHKCPVCLSGNIHRSHLKSWTERLKRELTHLRPYRCHDCGWRGWIVPVAALHHVEGLAEGDAAVDIESLDTTLRAEPKPARAAFSPRNLS